MSPPVSNILIVASHMDDEVISCGGTIAKHVVDGDFVTVCVIANRAYGHQYNGEEIKEEIDDCLSAQKVLGYQKFLYLGQKDECLDHSLITVITDLEKAVADTKPTVVYLPWSGDFNQDHRAVFGAIMVVCRPYAPHRVNTLIAYESMSTSPVHAPFIPSLYVDIGLYIEKKIQALKCYRREAREWPHPRSPEGIMVLAKRRGSEIGLEEAESFMVIREISR